MEDEDTQHLWCTDTPDKTSEILLHYLQDKDWTDQFHGRETEHHDEDYWDEAEEWLHRCEECMDQYYKAKKRVLDRNRGIVVVRAYTFQSCDVDFESFAECEISSEIKHSVAITTKELPGVFLLLIHPNRMVRQWASQMLQGVQPITPDMYNNNISDVISWMLSIVEFGLLDKYDVDDATWAIYGESVLPRELVCVDTPHAYWKGIAQVLQVLDQETTRSQFMGADGHRSIADTIVNVITGTKQAETQDPWQKSIFWPALECLQILLSKLQSFLWTYLTVLPDKIFKDIITHPVYDKAITGEEVLEEKKFRTTSPCFATSGTSTSVVSPAEPFAWLKPFLHSLLDVGDQDNHIKMVIIFLKYHAKCVLDPDNSYFDNNSCPATDAKARKNLLEASCMGEKVIATFLDIIESLVELKLYEFLTFSIEHWPYVFDLYLKRSLSMCEEGSMSDDVRDMTIRCLAIAKELLDRGLILPEENEKYSELVKKLDACRDRVLVGESSSSRQRRASGNKSLWYTDSNGDKFQEIMKEVVEDLKVLKDEEEASEISIDKESSPSSTSRVPSKPPRKVKPFSLRQPHHATKSKKGVHSGKSKSKKKHKKRKSDDLNSSPPFGLIETGAMSAAEDADEEPQQPAANSNIHETVETSLDFTHFSPLTDVELSSREETSMTKATKGPKKKKQKTQKSGAGSSKSSTGKAKVSYKTTIGVSSKGASLDGFRVKKKISKSPETSASSTHGIKLTISKGALSGVGEVKHKISKSPGTSVSATMTIPKKTSGTSTLTSTSKRTPNKKKTSSSKDAAASTKEKKPKKKKKKKHRKEEKKKECMIVTASARQIAEASQHTTGSPAASMVTSDDDDNDHPAGHTRSVVNDTAIESDVAQSHGVSSIAEENGELPGVQKTPAPDVDAEDDVTDVDALVEDVGSPDAQMEDVEEAGIQQDEMGGSGVGDETPMEIGSTDDDDVADDNKGDDVGDDDAGGGNSGSGGDDSGSGSGGKKDDDDDDDDDDDKNDDDGDEKDTSNAASIDDDDEEKEEEEDEDDDDVILLSDVETSPSPTALSNQTSNQPSSIIKQEPDFDSETCMSEIPPQDCQPPQMPSTSNSDNDNQISERDTNVAADNKPDDFPCTQSFEPQNDKAQNTQDFKPMDNNNEFPSTQAFEPHDIDSEIPSTQSFEPHGIDDEFPSTQAFEPLDNEDEFETNMDSSNEGNNEHTNQEEEEDIKMEDGADYKGFEEEVDEEGFDEGVVHEGFEGAWADGNAEDQMQEEGDGETDSHGFEEFDEVYKFPGNADSLSMQPYLLLEKMKFGEVPMVGDYINLLEWPQFRHLVTPEEVRDELDQDNRDIKGQFLEEGGKERKERDNRNEEELFHKRESTLQEEMPMDFKQEEQIPYQDEDQDHVQDQNQDLDQDYERQGVDADIDEDETRDGLGMDEDASKVSHPKTHEIAPSSALESSPMSSTDLDSPIQFSRRKHPQRLEDSSDLEIDKDDNQLEDADEQTLIPMEDGGDGGKETEDTIKDSPIPVARKKHQRRLVDTQSEDSDDEKDDEEEEDPVLRRRKKRGKSLGRFPVKNSNVKRSLRDLSLKSDSENGEGRSRGNEDKMDVSFVGDDQVESRLQTTASDDEGSSDGSESLLSPGQNSQQKLKQGVKRKRTTSNSEDEHEQSSSDNSSILSPPRYSQPPPKQVEVVQRDFRYSIKNNSGPIEISSGDESDSDSKKNNLVSGSDQNCNDKTMPIEISSGSCSEESANKNKLKLNKAKLAKFKLKVRQNLAEDKSKRTRGDSTSDSDAKEAAKSSKITEDKSGRTRVHRLPSSESDAIETAKLFKFVAENRSQRSKSDSLTSESDTRETATPSKFTGDKSKTNKGASSTSESDTRETAKPSKFKEDKSKTNKGASLTSDSDTRETATPSKFTGDKSKTNKGASSMTDSDARKTAKPSKFTGDKSEGKIAESNSKGTSKASPFNLNRNNLPNLKDKIKKAVSATSTSESDSTETPKPVKKPRLKIDKKKLESLKQKAASKLNKKETSIDDGGVASPEKGQITPKVKLDRSKLAKFKQIAASKLKEKEKNKKDGENSTSSAQRETSSPIKESDTSNAQRESSSAMRETSSAVTEGNAAVNGPSKRRKVVTGEQNSTSVAIPEMSDIPMETEERPADKSPSDNEPMNESASSSPIGNNSNVFDTSTEATERQPTDKSPGDDESASTSPIGNNSNVIDTSIEATERHPNDMSHSDEHQNDSTILSNVGNIFNSVDLFKDPPVERSIGQRSSDQRLPIDRPQVQTSVETSTSSQPPVVVIDDDENEDDISSQCELIDEDLYSQLAPNVIVISSDEEDDDVRDVYTIDLGSIQIKSDPEDEMENNLAAEDLREDCDVMQEIETKPVIKQEDIEAAVKKASKPIVTKGKVELKVEVKQEEDVAMETNRNKDDDEVMEINQNEVAQPPSISKGGNLDRQLLRDAIEKARRVDSGNCGTPTSATSFYSDGESGGAAPFRSHDTPSSQSQSLYSDIVSDDDFDRYSLREGEKEEDVAKRDEAKSGPQRSSEVEAPVRSEVEAPARSEVEAPVRSESETSATSRPDVNTAGTAHEEVTFDLMIQGEADDDNVIIDYNEDEQVEGLDTSLIGEADDDNAVVDSDDNMVDNAAMEADEPKTPIRDTGRPLLASSFYGNQRQNMSKADQDAAEKYLEAAGQTGTSPSTLKGKSLWTPPSQKQKQSVPRQQEKTPDGKALQKPKARAPTGSTTSRFKSRQSSLLDSMMGKDGTAPLPRKPAKQKQSTTAAAEGLEGIQPLSEVNRETESVACTSAGASNVADGSEAGQRTGVKLVAETAGSVADAVSSKDFAAAETVEVRAQKSKENEPPSVSTNRSASADAVVAASTSGTSRPPSAGPGPSSQAPTWPAAKTQPVKTLGEKDFLQWVLAWKCEWLDWALQNRRDFCDIPHLLKDCRYTSLTFHKQMPMRYQTMDKYYEVFVPLLMLETWAKLQKDYNPAVNPRMKCIVTNTGRQHTHYSEFSVEVPIPKGKENDPKFKMREYDFVIMSPRPESTPVWSNKFAIVKRISWRDVRQTKPQGQEGEAPEEQLIKMMDVTLQTGVMAGEFNFTVAKRNEFHVQVMGSLLTSKRQFDAIANLHRSPLARDILQYRRMEVFCVDEARMQETHKVIPCYQAEASDAAVKGFLARHHPLPSVFLLQGPPGTGKTTTIINIVGKLLKHRNASPPSGPTPRASHPKILLCAPSNAAVDILVKRLANKLKEMEHKGYVRPGGKKAYYNVGHFSLIRLGNTAEVHKDVMLYCLEEIIKFTIERNRNHDNRVHQEQIDELNKKIGNSELCISRLRNSDPNGDEIKKQRDFRAHLYNERDKVKEKQKAHQPNQRRNTNVNVDRIREKALNRADVICCTLNHSGSQMLQRHVYKQKGPGQEREQVLFMTPVIVDEATQCTEPDCLVPLQYGTCKLLLAGDPQQLPATVISQEASRRSYTQSLLERYYNYLDRNKGVLPFIPIHMLKTQYRMHTEICSFPSRQFYHGLVTTDPAIANTREKFFLNPYMLFDVFQGQEHRYNNQGHSYHLPESSSHHTEEAIANVEEANFIIALYKYIKEQENRQKLQHPGLVVSIGIITYYQTQKNYLKRLFQTCPNVEIQTVDSYQGKEKDIIIISCVRTSGETRGIGFVADPKRLNVSLTRARYALYIVGNFRSLATNVYWNALVNDANRRGIIVPATQTRDGKYKKLYRCKKRSNWNNSMNSGMSESDSDVVHAAPVQNGPSDGSGSSSLPEASTSGTSQNDTEVQSQLKQRRQVAHPQKQVNGRDVRSSSEQGRTNSNVHSERLNQLQMSERQRHGSGSSRHKEHEGQNSSSNSREKSNGASKKVSKDAARETGASERHRHKSSDKQKHKDRHKEQKSKDKEKGQSPSTCNQEASKNASRRVSIDAYQQRKAEERHRHESGEKGRQKEQNGNRKPSSAPGSERHRHGSGSKQHGLSSSGQETRPNSSVNDRGRPIHHGGSSNMQKKPDGKKLSSNAGSTKPEKTSGGGRSKLVVSPDACKKLSTGVRRVSSESDKESRNDHSVNQSSTLRDPRLHQTLNETSPPRDPRLNPASGNSAPRDPRVFPANKNSAPRVPRHHPSKEGSVSRDPRHHPGNQITPPRDPRRHAVNDGSAPRDPRTDQVNKKSAPSDPRLHSGTKNTFPKDPRLNSTNKVSNPKDSRSPKPLPPKKDHGRTDSSKSVERQTCSLRDPRLQKESPHGSGRLGTERSRSFDAQPSEDPRLSKQSPIGRGQARRERSQSFEAQPMRDPICLSPTRNMGRARRGKPFKPGSGPSRNMFAMPAPVADGQVSDDEELSQNSKKLKQLAVRMKAHPDNQCRLQLTEAEPRPQGRRRRGSGSVCTPNKEAEGEPPLEGGVPEEAGGDQRESVQTDDNAKDRPESSAKRRKKMPKESAASKQGESGGTGHSVSAQNSAPKPTSSNSAPKPRYPFSSISKVPIDYNACAPNQKKRIAHKRKGDPSGGDCSEPIPKRIALPPQSTTSKPNSRNTNLSSTSTPALPQNHVRVGGGSSPANGESNLPEYADPSRLGAARDQHSVRTTQASNVSGANPTSHKRYNAPESRPQAQQSQPHQSRNGARNTTHSEIVRQASSPSVPTQRYRPAPIQKCFSHPPPMRRPEPPLGFYRPAPPPERAEPQNRTVNFNNPNQQSSRDNSSAGLEATQQNAGIDQRGHGRTPHNASHRADIASRGVNQRGDIPTTQEHAPRSILRQPDHRSNRGRIRFSGDVRDNTFESQQRSRQYQQPPKRK